VRVHVRKFFFSVIELLPTPTAIAGVGILPSFVCLFFFYMISQKIDAARMTKRDVEMFHDEYWKPIYFGVSRP